MPSRGAHGAALLLSGPPARCQVVFSSAASTCWLPGDGILLPRALLWNQSCLHSVPSFASRPHFWKVLKLSINPCESPAPLLPLNSMYRGHACTASSPFCFPVWMADCNAIFLPVPLYLWFPPIVISSHFWACPCHRIGRWVQKRVRSAVPFLQILLHTTESWMSIQTARSWGWGFLFCFGEVLGFLQIFSVKGKTCIMDTHVLERKAMLQRESLLFLLIMFNQVQADRASDTLEGPGER